MSRVADRATVEPATRRGALPVGRVAGVPVELHWSLLGAVALLTWLLAAQVLPAEVPGAAPVWRWTVATAAALVFVATIALHESAHVLVARHVGVRVRRVTLWVVGGVSEMTGEPRSPGGLAAVAAAGPVTSAALGLGFLGLAQLGRGAAWPALVVAALAWLGGTNLLIAAFNLLPGAPLDGGRVLHGLVWRLTGDRERGRAAAVAVGRLVGFALTGFGVLLFLLGSWTGLWLAAVGWFVGLSAAAERNGGRVVAALEGRTAADAAHAPELVAQAGSSAETLVAALRARPPRAASIPVVGVDGDPVGVVTVGDLVRLGPADRATTRVREAGRPLPAERIVAADVPLERLAALGALPGTDLVAVVADHGRLTGTVTVPDLARLVELHRLGT
ncbi:site-2 protease family protein [Pseudonocardia xishanensis]|uniref:site-2 protease family protein n=1 Tax=Pseudonocardia xishanensis TaxID=630995 RepID=UPI0031E60C38